MKSSLKYAHLVGWESDLNDATLLDCSQGILIERQYSKTSDLILHIEKKRKEGCVWWGATLGI